ncbi:MAG: ERF family protein [Porphyromonadaceae bacterium]|nr:ERF family protein [Porphyromonadaceae bacterium]
MAEVQAVRKDSKNQAQRFNFRGIDAVMNAVGPALRKHGVVILPEDVEVHRSNGTTANGKQTAEVVLKVTYRAYGPNGDSIPGKVAAEAMDFGDKAIAKAMSVAYRTFLLQALTIPTDEPDPDSESYERGVPKRTGGHQKTPPSQENRGVPKRTAAEQCGTILDGFCHTHNLDGNKIREEYFAAGGKANPDMLRGWLAQNYGAGKVQ